MAEVYRSKVYTDRPEYADYDSPRKFMAIEGIIARRLSEYPKAICSYSGGADSDILIDLIESVRKMIPNLAPVRQRIMLNRSPKNMALRSRKEGQR